MIIGVAFYMVFAHQQCNSSNQTEVALFHACDVLFLDLDEANAYIFFVTLHDKI